MANNKKPRKVHADAQAGPKTKAQKNPKAATTQPLPKSVVSQNRSEGLRLFKLAGRPTTEQFVLVYERPGSEDDVGSAGSCGCFSQEVPSRAGREASGE